MSSWRSTFLVVVLCTVPLAGCKKKASAEPAVENGPPAPSSSGHRDEPEHSPFPTRIRLSPKAMDAAALRWQPAKREALVATLRLPGEFTANPDRSSKISSPVPGKIVEVFFQEGSLVDRGAALARIRVPDLGRLRGDLSSARARVRAARANAERLRSLAADKLAATQAYLDAEAEANALDATTSSLEQQLAAIGAGPSTANGYELVIRAPLRGIALTRNAVVGQPVTPDEVLATVADLSEGWFLARVFEKDLGRLRLGTSAEVEFNAYPDQRFPGVVEYIARQIDPVARTVTARITIKDASNLLRVGLFGTARVVLAESSARAAAILVPRNAVTEVGEKTVLFVHQPDGDFELHEVTLGEGAEGNVEILSGLREGEEVVVDGVFTLKSAALRSTLAEED